METELRALIGDLVMQIAALRGQNAELAAFVEALQKEKPDTSDDA